MKVSELPYQRVTLEEIEKVMTDVIARIKAASSVDEILKAREDYLALYLELYIRSPRFPRWFRGFHQQAAWRVAPWPWSVRCAAGPLHGPDGPRSRAR